MAKKSPASDGSALTRSAGQIRVMIVEDHPVARHGLSQLIGSTPGMEVCDQTGDASEALAAIRKQKPDVAVIDLRLQDGSGLELIKQVKAEGGETRMLVASVHDEALYAERSLHAGAMGYISKSEDTKRLLEAIRQIAQGQVYLSEAMKEHVLQRMMQPGGKPAGALTDMLTDRELEILEMIGEGQTTNQMAKVLHLSPKTVETHREHLKAKLNLSNSHELVRHAVQWVLEEG